MTPYELLELAQGSSANAIGLVSLAIAVLSGYVVVAYAVGAKLTRLQVVALNINYTIWWLYLAASGATGITNGLRKNQLAQELLGEPIASLPYSIHIYWSLSTMLLVTSLWFMWSIRHPKTKRPQ